MSKCRNHACAEALEPRRLLSVAVNTIFSEDFENAAPGWTVDVSTGLDSRNAWAIISPGYNSGHCAATANPGTNCTLTSPPISLPYVDQYTDHQYLTFWSKQNYALGATPTPQIREYLPGIGWGAWNIIEPNAGPLPAQSNGWNYFGADLGLFSGELVEVGFAHNGVGNVAWSIDNVQIQQIRVARTWFGNDGFENGWDGWTTYNGMWTIGAPSGAAPAPTEGSSLAGTAVDGIAPPLSDSTLWSPAFYMPQVNPGQHVVLLFDQYTDGGGVKNVTYQVWDPGRGWSTYMLFTEPPIFPQDVWTHEELDVTNSFAGQLAGFDDPIRIGFDSTQLSGLGWFIDNVRMGIAGTSTTGTISGSVWTDANNNGVEDPGEGGQVGRQVYLDLNSNGVLDAGEPTATAGFTGHYTFTNLQPGTYTVRQVLPAGWARTAPLAAAGTVTLAAGQVAAGPGFGDVQISTIPMNFAYLLTLAQHYNQPGTFASGDLNGDETVNFADLLLLAQNYGHALPSAAAAAGDSGMEVLRKLLQPRRR